MNINLCIGLIFFPGIPLPMLLFIIFIQEFIHLFHSVFTFYIPSGKFQQIVRYFQSIHCLKTNGCTPGVSCFTLCRLTLTDIFFKV